jgi:hypothetical protein
MRAIHFSIDADMGRALQASLPSEILIERQDRQLKEHAARTDQLRKTTARIPAKHG